MATEKRLEGKVALVTGGASGIGAETARVFGEHGAAVIVTDVNDELGENVAKEISDAGANAAYHHLDTSQEHEWEKVLPDVVSQFGRLDVLVNAAGRSGRMADGTAPPLVQGLPLDNWESVMSVNATGVFLGTKHAVAPMREAGGGSIINIVSIYSILGSDSNASYHASKGAARAFTKAAAVHCAHYKIRVNGVYPGFITTAMTKEVHAHPLYGGARLEATPMAEFGMPRDIALGCLYLASDDSRFVTGSELVIDGGVTATALKTSLLQQDI
ncbi:MAG: hypothetical protein CL731_04395 [Chloroflexi bacterium]|nr:hypothetical protein [Chloroflexota bacterium]